MLYSVPAFVRGNGCSRNAVAGIYALAKIHGLVLRVVMVGEFSLDAGHVDIIDAIVVKHFFRHLLAGHAVGEGNFGVLLNALVQNAADDKAQYHENDEDYPIQIHCSRFE